MQTSIDILNKTLQKTNDWLTELAENAPFASKEQAYSALRAVLHAVRDRMLIAQAVHFAAEFPLLLKGIYFDNWDSSANPSKERTQDAFLEHIALELRHAVLDIEPEHALWAVFQLLEQKISAGAIEKAKHALSKEIRMLIDNA
ncbi:MAG: hypothetical protein K0S11_549 [Gammaproteobacteria bacterium]|nr:hypothetical protein [Gammaproteobacteria bacterium]